MHKVETNNFRLKSRNSFLKMTKCITTKKQEKAMKWTNQIDDKIWTTAKALPLGK